MTELTERLRVQAHENPVGLAYLLLLCREAADKLENQEREIAALQEINDKQAGLIQRLLDLAMELDTAKAERDAAIADLRKLKDCSVCAYLDKDCPHGRCEEGEEFQWRGLKEV